MLFIFLSGVPSFLGYIIAKLHLNHCKASPCVFNFSFFLSSFYYRSSSWRLYMVVRQGFLSFFNCPSRFLSKLWPAKLHSKINIELKTCFVLRSSSILHLASEVQFFLPYLLRWWYVILDNFLSCFMIHKLSRMRYLNPSFLLHSWELFNPAISLLELSWVIFHLKPSIGNVSICGAYQWSKFSPILSAKAVFISLLISSKQLFPLVAGCHLIILKCFP